MKISPAGIDFIKNFEGLRLKAYYDQVGITTIGYGSTLYDNGEKVKINDEITEERAAELLAWAVNTKANAITGMIKAFLNQNQVDAVLSLVYNIGVIGFAKSTVLRMINENANDPDIRTAWQMWDKGTIMGKHVQLPGLTARRKKEADLYFKI